MARKNGSQAASAEDIIFCPLCDDLIAEDEATVTFPDIRPYRAHREPPVSVQVHRTCRDRLPQADRWLSRAPSP